MNPTEVFAAWMRAARQQAGATQQDIADHVGMRQQQIAKLETGKRGLTLDQAVAIAGFFGVTVSEAIGSTANSAHTELIRLRGVLACVRSAVNDHGPNGDDQ